MPWYDDQKVLSDLKAKIDEAEWADWKAASIFRKLEKSLPKEMRERTRIGSLCVDEIEGVEGLHCWVTPVDGYKKLLAPEASIRLLAKDGKVFFEGKWKETTREHIERDLDFFVWLAPKAGRVQGEKTLALRLKGIFRFLKHRKRHG